MFGTNNIVTGIKIHIWEPFTLVKAREVNGMAQEKEFRAAREKDCSLTFRNSYSYLFKSLFLEWLSYFYKKIHANCNVRIQKNARENLY